TRFQCCANIVNRGPAVRRIQRTGLEQRVGSAQPQPLPNIGPLLRLGEISRQQLLRIEAVGCNQPAKAAGSHTGYAPLYGKTTPELLLFLLKQRDQCPADIAQSDEAQIIGANAGFSGMKWLPLILNGSTGPPTPATNPRLRFSTVIFVPLPQSRASVVMGGFQRLQLARKPQLQPRVPNV